MKKLALNLSRAWPEINDIYVVSYQGSCIGRVWLASDRRGEDAWEWHISIPMQLPDYTKGRAKSLDEALGAFGNAFRRLIEATPADRFERAIRFLQAVEPARSAAPAQSISAASLNGEVASQVVDQFETATDPVSATAAKEGSGDPPPKLTVSASRRLVATKRVSKPRPTPALPEASTSGEGLPQDNSDLPEDRAAPPVNQGNILSEIHTEERSKSLLRDIQALLARHA